MELGNVSVGSANRLWCWIPTYWYNTIAKCLVAKIDTPYPIKCFTRIHCEINTCLFILTLLLPVQYRRLREFFSVRAPPLKTTQKRIIRTEILYLLYKGYIRNKVLCCSENLEKGLGQTTCSFTFFEWLCLSVMTQKLAVFSAFVRQRKKDSGIFHLK